MKKFFLMALSVFLFSTTASFAGNDDNSNKVANNENNEIEVSIEKTTPVREEVEWVTVDIWNPEKGEWTGEEEIKIYYNRNGYYEAKSMLNDWYRVEESDKRGYEYVIRFISTQHCYFNARNF